MKNRTLIALATSATLAFLSHAAHANSPSADTQEAMRIAGDFNGDNISDVIIVTPNGSFEYTGLAGGGFTMDVWEQTTPDFATGVQYFVGDYNGDGCSDVIILRSSGSTEWFGNGPQCDYQGTGLTQGRWSRPDLNPNVRTRYTVGDFNGDRCSDVIVQDTNGSYEYLGEGPSCSYGSPHMIPGTTFYPCSSFVRTDLSSANAIYDVGDYNADGATDLLISTAYGIYEYTGMKTPQGGFNVDVWQTSAYNFYNASTWSRDFNGDTVDDFILETSTSTHEYLGTYSGLFYQSPWSTNQRGWYDTFTYIGDFNGDDVSDVIFLTPSGVDMWIGEQNSYGGFNDWWGTADFTFTTGMIWIGDYNGDGYTDFIGRNNGGATEWFGNPIAHMTEGSWYRPDLWNAYFTFEFPPLE